LPPFPLRSNRLGSSRLTISVTMPCPRLIRFAGSSDVRVATCETLFQDHGPRPGQPVPVDETTRMYVRREDNAPQSGQHLFDDIRILLFVGNITFHAGPL
jgi:hypothetical protein